MPVSPNEFRRGRFEVHEQKPSFPWSKWQVATRVADGQHGFLRSIVTKELGAIASSQLIAHQRVSGGQLQPLEIETVGQQTLLFAAIPPGQCLASHLAKDGKMSGRSLSPAQVCKLGIAVAQSLAVMHDHSLVHGAVRADRIWIANKGQVILLRDPVIDLTNQGRPGDGDTLETGEAAYEYAAPEFGSGVGSSDRPVDVATDIYSFGCLLFRLVTGRPPIDAKSWDQAITQHAQTSHPALVDAVAQQGSGDPLLRVIAFATAKNPDVRFESAKKLSVALRAVLPMASDVVQKAPATVTTENLERVPASSSTAKEDAGDPELMVTATQEKRRKSMRRQKPLIFAGLAAATLLLIAGVSVVSSSRSATSNQPSAMTEGRTQQTLPDSEPTVSKRNQSRRDQEKLTHGYRLVDDDRLLYVPPYSSDSESVSLELLPPGPAAIVSIRPEFLLADFAAGSLADLFDAELSGLLDELSSRSGVSLESIERCTIAIHPGTQANIETSLAIELKRPVSIETLAKKLHVTKSRTSDGLTIYAGDEADRDAYFFPATEDSEKFVSRLAIGTVARITEVADLGGSEILLSRTLRSLWNHTSKEVDFAAMASPNFLFADGRTLLQSSLPEAIEPLKSFLIPDVSAALLIVRVKEDHLFAEARLAPSGGVSEAMLMNRWREAAQKWPGRADQFLIESEPDRSWRLLATRLPLMIRFFTDQSRFGVSDGAAVSNLYLPRQIVPQLSLAVSMAMNTPQGKTSRENRSAGVEEPTEPLTISQLLDRKMSVSFDQESLEFAIDTVVNEFQRSLPEGTKMPAVRIIGSDLQKMGITQNQQIRGFDKTEVSLRSVLTDLVLKANPDRTASGPTDPKQALIWVIAEDPQTSGQQAILVTTRKAAKDKYELPPEFHLAP